MYLLFAISVYRIIEIKSKKDFLNVSENHFEIYFQVNIERGTERKGFVETDYLLLFQFRQEFSINLQFHSQSYQH